MQLIFERHVAIQFLDKEAFDHATFEIPLYRSGTLSDRIAGIKGVTYNLDDDGKYSQTKFNKKDIFSEKVNKLITNKKFTMPNVKEGSIIELKYSTTSDIYWNMENWSFQDMIPTLYSQYEITVPQFFTFSKNFTGFINPEILPTSSNSRDGYESRYEGWVMKDVPGFTMEKHMRSYKNYVSRLEFELYSVQFPGSPTQSFSTTWNKVAENLTGSAGFGAYLNKGGFLKNDIEIVASQYETKEEKLAGIYEYIKIKMKWNGRYGEYTAGLKKAYKEGKGNVGDINLLLTTALRSADFDAYPIVLSTRSNGMFPISYPSMDKINYVIVGVQLEDKLIVMDATEDEFPMGLLPVRCFNGSAVVINGNTGQTINIAPTEKYKSVVQQNVSIGADGTITGEVKKVKSGYAALQFRYDIGEAGDEKKFIEKMEANHEGLTVESHSFENVKDIYKGIKEEYKVTIEDKVEMTDDIIYFNPMIHEGILENPFKLEKREYPVDYVIPIEEIYMLSLAIPEGYVIESLPTKAVVKLPEKACNFTYTATKAGDEIVITSRLKINKVVYTEAEYKYLKEFYNLMIQKHAEQIVLKRG